MNNKVPNDLKRIIGYVFKRYKIQILFSIVLITLSSLATVASSVFIKQLIDDYIIPITKSSDKDFTPLFQVLMFMACIYLVGTISTYLYSKLMALVGQGTLRDLRDDLFSKMEKLPIKYFDTHPHGDIMSVYTNDIDTLRQAIEQSFPQLFSSLITIIGVTVSMLIISPLLFLVVVVMVLIMVIAIKTISKKSSIFFNQQQTNLGKENGYIEEMVSGQKVIKTFVYEQEAIKKFDELNEELFQSSYRANAYANILMPTLGNLGNISYVVTAIAGSALAINGIGALTLGGLISFLQLNRSFTMPISQVSQQLNFVIMAMAGAKRVFNLLDQEVEVDEGIVTLINYEEVDGKLVETARNNNKWAWLHPHGDGSQEIIPLVGEVNFENVDFSYDGKHQILHDINLYAKQGQKIAFVGATGAGKTTITNLINRFYDIQSGTITYDGIDIKLIKKDSLRRSLGIVLQDTHLFTGTIADNIRYGKQEASKEDVLKAADISNVNSFVNHLDAGFDTKLTADGSGLSNGQRQLIAIARAALANAPVLILDEATSSIDSRTEKIVQDGMDKLMAGRTVFVIAHRLSTIVNSDVIMVMDHGRIIERGNHASLMKEKGTYYQLYTGGLELD